MEEEDEIEVAVLAVNAETAPDDHKEMTLIDTFHVTVAEVPDECVVAGKLEGLEEVGVQVGVVLRVDLSCREDLGIPRKSWIRICECCLSLILAFLHVWLIHNFRDNYWGNAHADGSTEVAGASTAASGQPEGDVDMVE